MTTGTSLAPCATLGTTSSGSASNPAAAATALASIQPELAGAGYQPVFPAARAALYGAPAVTPPEFQLALSLAIHEVYTGHRSSDTQAFLPQENPNHPLFCIYGN